MTTSHENEATGYSDRYSFDEAFGNAIKALSLTPSHNVNLLFDFIQKCPILFLGRRRLLPVDLLAMPVFLEALPC
jgi:hypothetical protein